MRKVCVNILVIRRVAVQILMRVYLKYLKAGVCYDDVEAEIFKRRYVAAHLGYDGEHLIPVREISLDTRAGVRMEGAGAYDMLLYDLGVVEKARFFIDIGEDAARSRYCR